VSAIPAAPTRCLRGRRLFANRSVAVACPRHPVALSQGSRGAGGGRRREVATGVVRDRTVELVLDPFVGVARLGVAQSGVPLDVLDEADHVVDALRRGRRIVAGARPQTRSGDHVRQDVELPELPVLRLLRPPVSESRRERSAIRLLFL
jgi:hypothetical protein